MVTVAATFGLCLTIVFGAYWAFVVVPEDQAARKLRRRLRAEVATPTPSGSLTRRAARLSALKGLDALLGRSGRLVDPLRRTVEQSGLSITIGLVVLSSIFAASSVFVLIRLLTGLSWAASVVGIAAGSAPYLLVRYAATRRTRLFEDQFPQAIDLIASSLRAGHAFTSGVQMVSDEVADPTGAEFRLLYDQQNFGMPLPDALKAFARRIPLLDARFFVTAVLIQREAGGNLSEILDNIATVIRERFRVKRQIRVISAHGRLTGGVLIAIPPTLGAVLFVINPDHWATLTGNRLGLQLIGLAIFLQISGTLIIRKLIRIEY